MVAVPGGCGAGVCASEGTGLVPSALRAPAQLMPSASFAVVALAGAREKSWSAPLRSACSCNLADREDRKKQQCGQERREGSHCLLKLPLNVCLLQRRAFEGLRVLEERNGVVHAWFGVVLCVGLLPLVLGCVCTRSPQEQRRAEQRAGQMRGEAGSRAAQHGEHQRVGAGVRRACGAARAKGRPVARGRHRRLDAPLGVGGRGVSRVPEGEREDEREGERESCKPGGCTTIVA